MKKIVTLLLVLLMCFSFSSCGEEKNSHTEKSDEGKYNIQIDITFKENFIFSKYDVVALIDGEELGEMEHGVDASFKARVSEGEHTLRFEKTTDDSVFGEVKLTVTKDATFKYTIGCSSDNVGIEVIKPMHTSISSDEAIGMSYVDVKSTLEENGFTDIKTTAVYDLTTEEVDKKNTIAEITINDSDTFAKDDDYYEQPTIVITYHLCTKIAIPKASTDLIGMNYQAVIDLFKTAGFTNVTATGKEKYDVVDGEVYGVYVSGQGTNFSDSDTAEFDSDVKVNYYIYEERETTTSSQSYNSNSNYNSNSSSNNSSGGSSGVTVPSGSESGDNLVWVPVNGGTKYHRTSTCSGMVNPIQVSEQTALENGYTACKKCY